MTTSLFDRMLDRIVLAVGLAKLLIVALFVVTIGTAAPAKAGDEGMRCTGQNLIEVLAQEAPDRLAQAREEAGQILNGDSILWKVERDGQPVSWLFGTMHMADPAIASLTPRLEDLISKTDTIAIETLDILDDQATMRAMKSLAHLTVLPWGESLAELVNPELHDELQEAVTARGLPMMLANRLRPWMIATVVSLPVCEMERKKAGAKVLDQVLALRAQENGKSVTGLETVEEQFTAIYSLPREFHISALEETLSSGNRATDMIATLKILYKQENMGMVLPLMKAVSPESYSGEGAARFQEVLLEKRNQTMLERSLPLIEKAPTLVAVGALHLPGEKGLVELYRKAGYSVTAVR